MNSVIFVDKIIDPKNESVIKNHFVVIEKDEIVKISPKELYNDAQYSSYEKIKTSNSTLLPGFIEMHSHIHVSSQENAYYDSINDSDETLIIRGTKAVGDALFSGVTTMRDLGSKNNVIFPIKKAIDSHIIPGPNLIPSGSPITTTGGHCNMFGMESDTTEEVVHSIKYLANSGAQWIKIIATGGNFTPSTNIHEPQYSQETIEIAVEEAHKLGLKVATHCHATKGIIACTNAHVDNLIHCSWIGPENSDEFYDYQPEIANQIANDGIFVDPTLALSYLSQLRGKTLKRDPSKRYEILRQMWDIGIKFVSGMDSGMVNAHFDDFAYIPEVMVKKMGISCLDAIKVSTITSAECLGLDDKIGSVSEGKKADLVIVKGDPSKTIEDLHNVHTIFKSGKLVKLNNEKMI